MSSILQWFGFWKKDVESNGKSSWRKVRAVDDKLGQEWQGLLPGDGGRKDLDQTLRKELLKYGELTQVTYDGFNSDPEDPSFGDTYWPEGKEPDLKKMTLVNTKRTTGAEKYTIESHIYARSLVYKGSFANRLITRVLGPSKKPIKRKTLNRKYHLDLPDDDLPEPTALNEEEEDKRPVWLGYIAWSDIDPGLGEKGVDLVVAFRGTILLEEWLIDANAYQLEDGKDTTFDTLPKDAHGNDLHVQVHPGFRTMYIDKPDKHPSPQKFIREQLKGLVNANHKKGTPVKSITFVGHSLGGAMAIVAASDIGMMRHEQNDGLAEKSPNEYRHELWKDISMVAFTFAAPRVGNFEFRQQLDETHVRVLNTVNIRDIVPAVPVSGIGITLGTTIGTLAAYVTRIHAKMTTGAERQAPPRPENKRHWFKTLRIWRAVHRYSNSGVRLLLNSDKLKALRRPALIQEAMKVRHNLEVQLQMLATQHILPKDRAEVWRDIALINKSGDALRKDICEALSIPPAWWTPLQHHGLEPQPATHVVEGVGVFTGTYWRRPRSMKGETGGEKSVQNSTNIKKVDSTDERTESDKNTVLSSDSSSSWKDQGSQADEASVPAV